MSSGSNSPIGSDVGGEPLQTPGVKRALARNTSALAVAQFSQVVSSFVLMPFLIKSFGLATYGVYLLTSSLSGYMSFLDLGVGMSLTKLLAEYRAKDDQEHVGRLVSSSVAFYLVVGCAGSIILTALAFLFSGIFHVSPEQGLIAKRILLIGAATSPFMWPIISVSSIQAGLNRHDLTARAALVAVIINAIIMIAVVAFTLGPVILVLATTATSLVVNLWNWRQAIKELGGRVRIGLSGVHASAMKPLVRLSAHIFIIQASTVLIYQQTDRLIVGYFTGAVAVTLYEAAAKVESFVRQIAGLTSSAVVPATSHLAAQKQGDTLRRLMLRGTRYTAALVLPIALGLIVLAKPLLSTWLGPSLVAATVPTQIYLLYWLLNVNSIVMSSMIVGIGRLDRVIWWQNLATFLNVALGILLTWKFGLIGVILGTVLSHMVVLPPYIKIGFELFDVKVRDWFGSVGPMYPPLLIVPAVAFVGYLLHLPDHLWGVALTGGASVGAYWLFVVLLLLDDSEKRDLQSMKTAVLSRLGLARPATR